MATALGASAFVTGLSQDAGASSVTTDAAVVTVHHARECASVRAASATTIVVPVVVDFGGASDTAQVSCVSVPAGSNGADVLTARAKLLGVHRPRYAISGLLCAIDDFPATGCGQQNGTHYAYWAYYHGGSAWTYASVGPASWNVFAGDVEGWRYEPDGTATPSDPPPRSPSDAPTLCPASGPPTTTTTTPSSPPPTKPPSTPPAVGASTSGGTGAAGTGPGAPSSAARGPTPFVTPGVRPPGVPGSTTPGAGAAPTTAVPPGAVTGALSSGSSPSPSRLASKRVAGGGLPLGLIIAGTLIVLFGAGAVIRTRRLTKAE